MKYCKYCKEEKELNCFYKGVGKDGRVARCKDCESNRKKSDYKKNKVKILERSKVYYEENKSKKQEYNKQYRKDNLDKFREASKKHYANNKLKKRAYYEKNKQEILEKNKANYKKTREKRIAYQSKYQKERYNRCTLFRLSRFVRANVNRIAKAIKEKRGNPSLEHIGCTLIEFKTHIESLWLDGMSWENHSVEGWHIDHVIPLDHFVKNSDDPWEANHYTNLQPLWAKDNLSKGNKLLD